MRSLLLLACLALAGCSDKTNVEWDDGRVEVFVILRDARPADAAAKLRAIADALDRAYPKVESAK